MGTRATPVGETQSIDERKPGIDGQIQTLERQAKHWAKLPIAHRIEYLNEICRLVNEAADEWVLAACQAKGLSSNAPAAAEEWGSGPWAMLYSLNRYLETLRALERDGGLTVPPQSIRIRSDGQVIARIFPETAIDGFLLNGVNGEVWMDPVIAAHELPDHMGDAYLTPPSQAGVALVLGAGNISSIPPLDVLHKMLVDHRVVLLKMNPVNDRLGPVFEQIFGPLIRDGYMEVCYGGPEVGAYVSTHPMIDEIHMTGSDRTHDAIVWGAGIEAAKRKQAGSPFNSRTITSELGNVSPLIVVPGPWNDADIRFQAEHIVTTKLHNAGFNCIATQVLVLPQQWDRSEVLVDAIRAAMKRVPPRKAYYPGARERQEAIAKAHADSEAIDGYRDEEDPRLIVRIDSADPDESLFQQECFASVLGITTIRADTTVDYLRTAVRFCNERLWGTLGATILIHPSTVAELGPAFDDSIAQLRYGTVGVNIWCGIGFLISQLPWGAFPGHTLMDIQSGIGKVHNTKVFDCAQKSVLYGPFYPYPRSLLMGSPTLLPKPPWFVLHKRALDVNKFLTSFEYDRDPAWIRKLLVASMKG